MSAAIRMVCHGELVGMTLDAMVSESNATPIWESIRTTVRARNKGPGFAKIAFKFFNLRRRLM